MMKELCGQTKAADMEIVFVQYVLASGSPIMLVRTARQLYLPGMVQKCSPYFRELCARSMPRQRKWMLSLPRKINDGEIDGVMFVSASPDG